MPPCLENLSKNVLTRGWDFLSDIEVTKEGIEHWIRLGYKQAAPKWHSVQAVSEEIIEMYTMEMVDWQGLKGSCLALWHCEALTGFWGENHTICSYNLPERDSKIDKLVPGVLLLIYSAAGLWAGQCSSKIYNMSITFRWWSWSSPQSVVG